MLNVKHLLIAGASGLLLSACGSESSNNGASPTPTTPTYSISGQALDLKRGQLTLHLVAGAVTEDLSLQQTGAFSFTKKFAPNTTLNLSISTQPDGQICELSTNEISVGGSDITDLNISCSDIPYEVTGLFTSTGPQNIELHYSGSQTGTVAISTGASFTLPGTFVWGDQLTITQPEYYGARCSVTSLQQTIDANIDDLNIECHYLGSMAGNLINFNNGQAIANAQLVLYRQVDGQSLEVAQTTSSDNGLFEFTGIDINDNFTLSVLADGFISNSINLSNSDELPDIVTTASLTQAASPQIFATTSTINITDQVNTNLVSIPANSLITANGETPQGNITIAVTPIDPSSNPELMPGNYQAVSADGGLDWLESFGALAVEISDETGQKLNLKAGSVAEIRIPVALGSTSSPANMPLYHFNQQSGLWQQEGEATLVSINGQRYYQGNVSHFSTWNADYAYQSVSLNGCVQDNQGNPVNLARITATGSNYIGQSSSYSDSNGNFSIRVKPNSTLLLSAQQTGLSNTLTISSTNTDSQLNQCLQLSASAATVTLTWGANPQDLDTHFWGPKADTQRFHIYYGHKEEVVNDVFINLDVDDINSFGPEILTIPDFPLAGRYRYAVRHYSGSGTMTNSPTRVELLINGQRRIFVPSADIDSRISSDTWVVFDIIVDDQGNTSIVTIDDFTSSSNADALGQQNFISPAFKTIATENKHVK